MVFKARWLIFRVAHPPSLSPPKNSQIASAPVANPAATLTARPSPPPTRAAMACLTSSYKQTRSPPYNTWRCSEGTTPFHRAAAPSSRAMVATVPTRPLGVREWGRRLLVRFCSLFGGEACCLSLFPPFRLKHAPVLAATALHLQPDFGGVQGQGDQFG